MAALLFGFVMPLAEVVLVLAGLCILGWESLCYSQTHQWDVLRIGLLYHPPHPNWLQSWVGSLPLSGSCIGGGIFLFFALPPAYAFG